MTVSVIVPIYHGEQYIPAIMGMIERNVESLSGELKQKEGTVDECSENKIQLLFVNDSPEISLDNIITPYIVDNTKSNLEIKLINNEVNSGIHFSRVAGLRHATGDYIMFFDQDDTITDNCFQSQIVHLYKNTDVLIANGIAEFPDYQKYLYRYGIMQWTAKYKWFYSKFDCRIISPGQCLIRKSAIPQEWYDNIMKVNGADDYFLWLMMLSQGKKFHINRDKLYTHVYTSTNTSLDMDLMHGSVREIMKMNEKIQVIDKKTCKTIMNRIEKNKKSVFVRLIELMNRA